MGLMPELEQMISVGNGGQRGIRTLDTVSRIHAFQACAFNHSATCPWSKGCLRRCEAAVGRDI